MAEATIVKPPSETLANVDTNLGDLDLNDEVRAKLEICTGDSEEHQEKKQKALKGVRKLLDISEKYSAYCSEKMSKVLEQTEQERVDNLMRHKKSRKKNDLSNIQYFKGILKDYQVTGVSWLKTLYEHGVNGILADEMGLGKTVQVIALICHIFHQLKGPFLIVVPLSTLPNWRNEFQRFAPEIPVVVYHGDKSDRYKLMHDILKIYKVNGDTCRSVVLTTLKMVALEMTMFKKITWKYLIVDEGHSLKNHKGQASQNMRSLNSLNKLILTGTPLQNNLKELWSILNFIMPQIFKKIDTFSSLFMLEDFGDNSKIVQDEETNHVISAMHKILQPFILRRTKSEVLLDLMPKKEVVIYCPLSALQRTLYIHTIQQNVAGLKREREKEPEEILDSPRPKRRCTRKKFYGESDSECELSGSQEKVYESITQTVRCLTQTIDEPLHQMADKPVAKYVFNITMQSPLSMFKKIVNHPYLVNMPVTPEGTLLVDDRLITESGKMLVLDILLSKLRSENHKVLIFSTLVMMLDIIEELMIIRKYTYRRIDGNYGLEDRDEAVTSFNTDANIFAFLISTRAGGLGLNLIGADTVIIYDRDWNPQVDLQAQDRCHRIGQTKPVVVYTLMTKNTVDEKILNCGNMKRKLEKVIVKKGKFTDPTATNGDAQLDLQELQEMLEKDDSSVTIHQNTNIFTEEEWNKLLDRSDLYEQMDSKKDRLGKTRTNEKELKDR